MAIKSFKHDRPTIGILAGWSTLEGSTPDYYRASVIRGLQSAARIKGCHLFLSWGNRRVGDPQGIEANQVYSAWPVVSPKSDFVPVGPWNTDGLIVFTPLANESQSLYLQDLISEGFPVLFIATGEKGAQISVNNKMGIYQAVAHLAEHGHSRIAFLAGLPTDPGDSQVRLDAYHDAIAAHNLESDPDLVTWGWHNLDEGYKGIKELLRKQVKFTGVVASNDNSAIGAMSAIREAGLKIPQDIAIIGFDDQQGAIAQVPPLTTVHVPLDLIGEQAVLLMADHITKGTSLESVQIPTRLMQRQSCGCLPNVIASTLIKSNHKIIHGGRKSPATSFEEARQRLVNEMLSTLPAQLRFPAEARIQQVCSVLVDAFYHSLQQNDSAGFQEAITTSVQDMEITESNTDYWQEMISALRREMAGLPVEWKEGNTQHLAEDMLHLARAVIAESAQRRDHRHQYQQTLHERAINTIAARLSVALSEEQVVELLDTNLATIGIRHARLLFFEGEHEDPVAWSYPAGLKKGDASQRFPSREFPPPGLYPDGELLNLILLPLFFQNEVLGYAAFDAGNLGSCAVIAKQLATTITVSRLHAQVVELSLTDTLTNLHNRRYLDIFFKNEFARSQRFSRMLSVIMVDLDHFKEYNDLFGHAAGDQALRQLAQCLSNGRRSSDVVVRTGGEEFVVILQETDINGTIKVAEQLRSSVAALSGLKRQITISLGVATLNKDTSKPDALLHHADQALYEAKRTGRNKICVYEEK